MPVKNRIRHWRLQLEAMEQQEFADIIGFSTWILEKWEQQQIQPTLEALCRIKDTLLPLYPDLMLDDLIDYKREE